MAQLQSLMLRTWVFYAGANGMVGRALIRLLAVGSADIKAIVSRGTIMSTDSRLELLKEI